MTQTVIVGGGATGILCALRLSQNIPKDLQSLMLIEGNEVLGGKFFFSNIPVKSGWGFEKETPATLDTLKRHIFLYLSEDEKNCLENWVVEKTQSNVFNKIMQKRYFIKKELLNAEYALLSNSEFLTKKDSEILQQISRFHESSSFEEEKEQIFEQSSIWKALSKNSQESIKPILDSMIGKYSLECKVKILCKKLSSLFYEPHTYHDPFFLRTTEIESALMQILIDRGVQIQTKCLLKSIVERDYGYELFVGHTDLRTLQCEKVILTISPYNIRTIIQNENLSPQLSRFVTKIQPTSLVSIEILDFNTKVLELFENKLNPLDTVYFPVESVEGFVTTDGRFICSQELDYETSLQAPAVRESLTAMRRAIRRILKPEFADELKKGSFIRKTEVFEKIILQSVAFNVPEFVDVEQLKEFNDVSLGFKNIYVAGDYFYSLGDLKWKSITKSVDLVMAKI